MGEFSAEIGSRARLLRTMQGWSIAEAANQAKTAPRVLREIESGKSAAVNALPDLANAYRRSLSFLLFGEESAADGQVMPNMDRLIVEKYQSLRHADRGLLQEVFVILKYGPHDARESLLRHLDLLRKAFPVEEMVVKEGWEAHKAA